MIPSAVGQAAELFKPGPWASIPPPGLIFSRLKCQVRDANGPQCPQPDLLLVPTFSPDLFKRISGWVFIQSIGHFTHVTLNPERMKGQVALA